ncbi:proline-rich receptor-like protein kinase PERK1 [Echria macrotheca]|uniref:Proline-rich receptor-like protein kinase PERK1 n=1 Tax=Echria macrotheca TaxID=438768 RepID=A0AAJ0FD36_9PEZI|nr:proline-rich receptor-like protein kinase PERK1 [Echria macrotheca]
MRCLHPALFFALLTGAATAFAPAERRRPDERSWTPARETGASQDRVGWSPKPTDAPVPPMPPPRFGQMDLLRRDGFTMGTDTCGFVSGFSSAPVTCVRQSAYCTNDGAGNMDCCTGDYSQCSKTMYTTCIDYTASENGACSNKGAKTICCWAQSPSCYSLVYSTSASPGKVFTILQCQTTSGLDTLLATPPAYTISASRRASSSSSESESSTSSSASSTTTDPAAATTTPATSSSSSNTGAIVGGVVGGIAALGLAAFLLFFFLIKKRQQSNAGHAGPSIPPTYMPVNQTPQGFPPPGAAFQPYAGAGAGAGVYAQPGGEDYKPYGDVAAASQNQFMQQTGYAQPPPPAASTSPGPPPGGYVPYGQGGGYHPGVPVQELPVQYALGTGSNRAELGH